MSTADHPGERGTLNRRPDGWGIVGFFWWLDGYQAGEHVAAERGIRPLSRRARLARWLVDMTPTARRIRRQQAAESDRTNHPYPETS